MPELSSYWFKWSVQSLGNTRKVQAYLGDSILETDVAWEKVFFWFHLRSEWMNWLDEYEAISSIQSLKA